MVRKGFGINVELRGHAFDRLVQRLGFRIPYDAMLDKLNKEYSLGMLLRKTPYSTGEFSLFVDNMSSTNFFVLSQQGRKYQALTFEFGLYDAEQIIDRQGRKMRIGPVSIDWAPLEQEDLRAKLNSEAYLQNLR